MPTTKGTLAVIAAVCTFIFRLEARGEDSAETVARRLMLAGDLAGAEATYDRILAANAQDLAARLGRAHVRAYQRKFLEARQDFEAVLSVDPGNLGALIGLGYALAWSGAFAEAESQFRSALRVAPDHADVTAGLAWVALWRGDAAGAARLFRLAAQRVPESASIQVGLGQALLASGRRSEARSAFSRALALEPDRADARQALADAHTPPLVDVTVFGGLTDLGGDIEPGLRFGEVAVSPSDRTRFWLQIDDSLSLDAPGIRRENTRAPSYFGGGSASYAERYATRIEGGVRKIPGMGLRPLFRAEQRLEVGTGGAVKLGGWLGPLDDRLETLAHAGAEIPIGARVRLEPNLFWSRSGLPGEHEVRGLLAATWRLPAAVACSAGIAVGRAFSPRADFDGTLGNAFVGASIPLIPAVRGHFLLQHERSQVGPPLTVYAIGINIGLGGRP